MALWHGARRLAPRPLAEKCGALLAEWVDATAEEMHDRIDSMSEVPAADAAGQRMEALGDRVVASCCQGNRVFFFGGGFKK